VRRTTEARTEVCAARPLLAGALVLLLAACAGNGEGLDQNGNPIGSGSSSGSSSGSASGSSSSSGSGSSGGVAFETIQDQVFTPICSKCHAGAGAPEGMQLTEGVAYSMIVDVPSQEVPTLDRITPGDAADSYLVQKIMGTAAVGAQMPDGCPVTQPCLSQATIDMIVQWVDEGAPPPASSSSSGGTAAEAP
jgi:hypothetical protein